MGLGSIFKKIGGGVLGFLGGKALKASKDKNAQSPKNRLWQATGDYEAALSAARQPTAAEQMLQKQATDFLNWEGGAGKDVRNAPGIETFLNVGQLANERAAQERMGTGGLQLGRAGSTQQAANMRQLLAEERANQFGASLENAIAQRRAQAMGSLTPLAQLGANRASNILSATGGREQYWGNMAGQKQGGGWGSAIGSAIGTVASAFI